MMVKVCGITTREDAVASVEAGASALGFNFYSGSPRCIDAARAAEIGAGLDVLKVGVFVNEPPERIEEIVGAAGLDVIQLHGDERSGARFSRPVWKACRVRDGWAPDELDAFAEAEAFVLDGPAPGSGIGFVWSRARGLRHRIILAGGLGPDNVEAAIREVRPWGVDACSRLEKSPGFKDHDKVRRFVRAALAVQL